MNQLRRVQQELASFILFGGMMSKQARQEVAELLYLHLVDPAYDSMKQLGKSIISKDYPKWNRLISRVLQQRELRRLTQNNEDFALSVARETLHWCKKINNQFENKNIHSEDEAQLKKMRGLTDELTDDRWKALLDFLIDIYPERKEDWVFWKETHYKEFQDVVNTTAGTTDYQRELKELRVIRNSILNEWDRLLSSEKSQLQEVFMEQAFSQYYGELNRKVAKLQELGDLMAPFFNFLGHVWNDAIGNWNKINWKDLENYSHQLRRDRHLRELAYMLGRWNSTRHSLVEEQLQKLVPQKQWKPNPYGKSEIIGIHYSNQLSSMLPSETSLLSSPETEIILAKKYVEKKLLTFQYRSQDFSIKPKKKDEKALIKKENPGPFVMVIDTSGSMFGDPERVAKALALAILEIALRQKRMAYLISFSTGIQTTEMTGMEENLAEMIEFLKMSFHGGTDIQPALKETLRMLKEKNYKKADVLVISDFVIPRLDRQLYEQVMEIRREQGVQFHSMYITRRHDPNQFPLPIFDHHWVYDMEDPQVLRQTIDHFRTFEDEEIEEMKSPENDGK
ncbi:MAG: VWA domain-containing protein [Bacteroidia bacterium]|nr:VWA domain-containing protein [Bacteroidia bacterium]